MALTVTFDTNALNDVLSPNTSQRGASGALAGRRVRAAIEAGSIQAFFCETMVTLEGIQKKDRAEVLGSTRLERHWTSTGSNAITLNLAIKQDRKPLDPKFSDKIQTAKRRGFRALRAPARVGSTRVRDEDGTFFAPDGPMREHLARMDKANDMATAIAVRGLGHAKAVALGRKFADCDDASNPELWFKGLLSASRRQIKLAVNEWADGDSIASHYGHGIALFCSEDRGRNASGASVLDDDSRRWLNDEFGIQFVMLPELAKMVTA